MTDRVFACDIEPRGDGGWDLWISEQPYRGVDTDAVCGHLGKRKRVGAAYTSRWFVSTVRVGFIARRVAAATIRKAERLAVQADAENEIWRANAQRERMRVTSDDVRIPPEQQRP